MNAILDKINYLFLGSSGDTSFWVGFLFPLILIVTVKIVAHRIVNTPSGEVTAHKLLKGGMATVTLAPIFSDFF